MRTNLDKKMAENNPERLIEIDAILEIDEIPRTESGLVLLVTLKNPIISKQKQLPLPYSQLKGTFFLCFQNYKKKSISCVSHNCVTQFVSIWTFHSGTFHNGTPYNGAFHNHL